MPDRTDTLTIDQSLPQVRLDVFLREKFTTVSRGTIQRLIEEGHIKVDGKPVKPTHSPRRGEVVEIHWPVAKPATLQAVEIPLSVLFEDEDLVVIDKTPDLVVHPAAGNEERTLVNAMLHHCRGQLSGIGGVERPGIVHRLDKDTTGCILVAKNDETHLGLSKQFADRTVEKTYLAIVHGELADAAGDIRADIARHPSHRKVMTVIEEGRGKEAWTSYRVMERLRGSTLVEVSLHTGRTHQIRVHFKHIGHPLVGDSTYGKRQIASLERETGYLPPRVMLHSFRLSFVHPRTARRHLLQAPIPPDFREAMESLKRTVGWIEAANSRAAQD